MPLWPDSRGGELAPMRVVSLHVHPVKSCAAIPLDRAEVGTYGLVGDREWLVVGSDGLGLTQRRLPAMALVRPRPTPDGGLVLTAPGRPDLVVEHPRAVDSKADVWGNELAVGDAGDAAAAWFSAYLGVDARLVAIAPGYDRPVGVDRDPGGRGAQVSFADGYPLLLSTEVSLADLVAKASEAVPMERFRPNLVIDGEVPWDEDHWGAISVGGVGFDVVKGCARCAMPQVDQQTAVRHREPALVLAAHRLGEDGKTYFGQNVVHHQVGGTIAVGDEVTVLRRR